MTNKCYQEPRYDLNKAAKTIKQAAENLRDRLGDRPLRRNEISDEILKLSSYGRNSIYPSDYCYNLINKDPRSFERPLFEQTDRNVYRYLGPRNKYSGIIYWKGKPVGKWVDGHYILDEDPRSSREKD
jgi:hypothetical protein